jgi:RNA recognition motif-containing protein
VSTNIYVGNLPWSVDDEQLRDLFSQHGQVERAKVIYDRDTDRSRGFGFVEMADADADNAISKLDGYEMNGRPLKVNKAKPREGGGNDKRRRRRDA